MESVSTTTDDKLDYQLSPESVLEITSAIIKDIKFEYDLSSVFINGDLTLVLIVKYPNIVITNSKGRSKHLGDVYVRFVINDIEEDPKSKELTGNVDVDFVTRSHFNKFDFMPIGGRNGYSVYIHSHIRTLVRYNSISTVMFCYGKSVLSCLIETRVFLEELPHILIMYKKFLEWESLEGVPYTRMELTTPRSDDESDIKRSIPELAKTLAITLLNGDNADSIYNPFNLDLTLLCDNIVAYDVPVFEYTAERLTTILFNNSILNFKLKTQRDSAGVVVVTTKNNITRREILSSGALEALSINFKNEVITPTIEADEDCDTTTQADFEKVYDNVKLEFSRLMVDENERIRTYIDPRYEGVYDLDCLFHYLYYGLVLTKHFITKIK